MTFASVHGFFEEHSPAGAGFALEFGVIRDLIHGLLESMRLNSAKFENLPLDQGKVRFSFAVDPGDFDLSNDFEISLKLRVWLHPRDNVDAAIVTLTYEAEKIPLRAAYDGLAGEFVWNASSSETANLIDTEWNSSDAPLIEAGYVAADGSADKQKFLEEIFYGFVWINARNLLPSLLRNIPFPQVQQWFLAFKLQPPFETRIGYGYLKVWTEEIIDVGHVCGISHTPSTVPPPSWSLHPGTPGSPIDNESPPLIVYAAAVNLARWQANGLAPAVMLSGKGGAFIRFGYDVAVSLQSFDLQLVPAADGGKLVLEADLRVLGLATAWIDGPSGTKLSFASLGITADGHVHGAAKVAFKPTIGRIDIGVEIDAQIDRNSVDLSGGGLWPLTAAIAEIAELLVHVGVFKLNRSYTSQSQIELFDVSDIVPPAHSLAYQRVGTSSLLVGFVPRAG